MKDKYAPQLDLDMMLVNTNRDFSFIIVDGKTLLIEVAGVKPGPSGETKYSLGLFVITDRSGHIISTFKDYFDRMVRQARPVTEQELA